MTSAKRQSLDQIPINGLSDESVEDERSSSDENIEDYPAASDFIFDEEFEGFQVQVDCSSKLGLTEQNVFYIIYSESLI